MMCVLSPPHGHARLAIWSHDFCPIAQTHRKSASSPPALLCGACAVALYCGLMISGLMLRLVLAQLESASPPPFASRRSLQSSRRSMHDSRRSLQSDTGSAQKKAPLPQVGLGLRHVINIQWASARVVLRLTPTST